MKESRQEEKPGKKKKKRKGKETKFKRTVGRCYV